MTSPFSYEYGKNNQSQPQNALVCVGAELACAAEGFLTDHIGDVGDRVFWKTDRWTQLDRMNIGSPTKHQIV